MAFCFFIGDVLYLLTYYSESFKFMSLAIFSPRTTDLLTAAIEMFSILESNAILVSNSRTAQ
jgi:hypothetical protein